MPDNGQESRQRQSPAANAEFISYALPITTFIDNKPISSSSNPPTLKTIWSKALTISMPDKGTELKTPKPEVIIDYLNKHKIRTGEQVINTLNDALNRLPQRARNAIINSLLILIAVGAKSEHIETGTSLQALEKSTLLGIGPLSSFADLIAIWAYSLIYGRKIRALIQSPGVPIEGASQESSRLMQLKGHASKLGKKGTKRLLQLLEEYHEDTAQGYQYLTELYKALTNILKDFIQITQDSPEKRIALQILKDPSEFTDELWNFIQYK